MLHLRLLLHGGSTEPGVEGLHEASQPRRPPGHQKADDTTENLPPTIEQSANAGAAAAPAAPQHEPSETTQGPPITRLEEVTAAQLTARLMPSGAALGGGGGRLRLEPSTRNLRLQLRHRKPERRHRWRREA